MKNLPQISEAEFEVMKIVWKYAPINTNEITENSHFAISPNPANAILHLQFQNGITINKLMIRDITGKLIVEQLDDVAKINVERLAKGIYILEAHSSEKNYQTRFVKE